MKTALLLLAVVAVVSATVTQIDYATSGWTLTHISTVYDDSAATTTFTWSITTTNLLSHWTLASSCALNLAAGQLWQMKIDSTTGLTGYEYPIGQAAGTTETYTLVINGDAPYGTATFALKGNLEFASSTITGPVCSGGTSAQGECDHPADASVSCDNTAALAEPSTGAYPNYVGQTTLAGNCPNDYTLTRNFLSPTGVNAWTACHQTVTVSDTQAPTFSDIPTYVNWPCATPLPPFANISVSDNCDSDVLLHTPCEEVTNTTCPTNQFYVRTWTATDSCGNSKCLTQTIAIIDNQPPTLSGVPESTTVECNGNFSLPATPTVTATDSCGCFANPSNPVTYTEQYNPGECANTYELVWTWTSEDCCGNIASASSTYTVVDTTAPSISLTGGVSPNGTFQCDNYPVDPYPATTSDICMSSPPPYTVNETRHDGSCVNNFVLTRIYSVSDNCGNTNSLVSVISVVDTTAPTWDASTLPADVTVQCDGVTEPADPTATDNCGPATVTRQPDVTVPGSCANQYHIIRSWIATDQCSNSVTYTQTVTVIDTVSPVFNNQPADTTADCESVPDPATVCAADNCNGVVIDYTETRQDYSPCSSSPDNFIYNLTRTWIATDACGNTASWTQVINVYSRTAPVLTPSSMADETQECSNFSMPAAPTAVGYCLTATVNNYTWVEPGTCPQQYTVHVSYQAIDGCGNNAWLNYSIFVVDTTAPVFSNAPADTSNECTTPAPPTVDATDNCDPSPSVTGPVDTNTSATCAHNYVLSRVWTATDACGNSATTTQSVTVYDNTAPVLSNKPASTEVDCASVPPPPSNCATDNCDGVTIAYTETRMDYAPCTSSQYIYQLSRTWIATDACGKTDSYTQVINVYARTAPVLTPASLPDVTQSCDSVSLPAAPTATGHCLNVTVTNYTWVQPGTCPQQYTIHNSFEAVDTCGNSAWLNFSIFVVDTTAPVITNPPADTSNQCTTPAPPTVDATDNCDSAPVVTGPVDTNTSVTCNNGYTLDRVWTATDACGNAASVSQTVTVYDNTKPTFDSTPQPTINVQCTPPTPPTLTASDNCGGSVFVNFSQTNTPGSCAYQYTLTNTWTAFDNCLNEQTFTQTVVVHDTTAPLLGTIPADTTVNCAPPVPPVVCASDNCAGVYLTFGETIVNQTCAYNYDIIRTWTATDLCGNSVSASQKIHVRMPNPPTFDQANPGDSTISCTLPTIPTPTASAQCGTATVANHSWTEAGNCSSNFKQHVSFSATDACGQVTWYNYTITVQDKTPPTVSWYPAPPANGTVTCGNFPAAPTPTVYDNCGSGASVSGPVESYSTACDYLQTLTRTWTFTDACFNTFTVVQILTGVHTVPPTFTDEPASTTADCNSTVPVAPASGHDSCGQPLTATEVTTTGAGTCADDNYSYRTYTLTDICLLTTTYTQTVYYDDTFAPVLTYPSDSSYNNYCPAAPSQSASATDNCDPAPVVSSNLNTSGQSCAYVYVNYYTWTATDRCGNVATAHTTQSFTWTATPTFSGLPSSPVTAECDSIPSPATVLATDYCGNNVPVFYNETRIDGSCNNQYTLVRYWFAQDSCGGQSSYTQTINVQDNSAPTICNAPADVNVQCGFVPEPPTVSAGDNCAGVTLTYSSVTLPGASCCNYQIQRTWTATDACGLVTTAVQTITVHDDIKPVLVNIPPSISCAECPYTPPVYNVTAYKPALAYGYCLDNSLAASTCSDSLPHDSSLTVTVGSSPVTLTVASGTAVRWIDGEGFISASLTDGINSYNLQLHLSGESDTPTAGSPIESLNPSCYGTLPGQVSPAFWQFYPTLTGNLTFGTSVIFFTNTATNSQFGPGANGINTLLGGYVSLQQVGGPAAVLLLEFTADGFGTCSFNHSTFPELCPCAEQVNVTFTTTSTPGTCDQDYTIVNTWCANDEDPSHTVCASQTITVCDTTAPSINGVPPSTTINCEDPVPADSVTASDLCDPSPYLYLNQTITPGSCPQEEIISRVYTAIDHCGNTNVEGHTITVVDIEAPVLSGVPSNPIISYCDAEASLPVVTATDNCQSVTPTQSSSNSTSCPYQFEATYTYNVADDCGNAASSSFNYIVLNPYPVVLSGVPASTTVECPNPAPGFTVTASQTCQGDLTSAIVFTETTDSSNPCDVVVSRSWSVEDSCGHTASGQQTVHIVDTTPPQWTSDLPAAVTVQCDAVPDAANLTASDTCTGVTYGYTETPTPTGACPNNYILTRVWTASDACGHTISYTQVITVVDTTDPTITPSSVPDVVAFCKAIPAPPSFCAADNCDGVTLGFTQVKTQTGPAGCDQYYITRTASAHDGCGNSASVSYNVFVNDTVAPVCPAGTSTTIECNPSVPVQAPADPVCSEDCSSYTVTHDFPAPQQLSCADNQLYTFNYIVADLCGNAVTVTSTITTVDTTPPTLSGVPTGGNRECASTWVTAPPTVSDNCDPAPQLFSNSSTVPGSCAGTYVETITWWGVDECGNVSPLSYTVYNVQDTIAPTWTSTLPANVTSTCDNVPAMPVLTASDLCDTTVTVVPNQQTIPGTCANAYTLVNTWTATDCSGNGITWSQTVTIVDTAAPTISAAPADVTIDCKGDFSVPTICASDVCNGIDVSYTQTRTNTTDISTCDDKYTLFRQWVATDACGNTATTDYTITVDDNVAPDCTPIPPPTSVYCLDAAGATPVAPSCSDHCNNAHVTPYYSETDYCFPTKTAYYSWFITDDCGNSFWSNTSVNVYDNVPPVFDITDDMFNTTVQCDSVPAPPTVTASDQCSSANVTLTTTSTQAAGCQNYEITNTWVATDNCGNTATWVQVITVVDTTAPTWTSPLPTDMTLSCADTLVLPTMTASDNCGSATVTLTSTPLTADQSCSNSNKTQYTWTATDACGNQISTSAVVTIDDYTPPTITSVVPYVNASCDSVPAPPSVCCSDICNGVTLTYTQVLTPSGQCDSRYDLFRTWTCTDACGNVATTSQQVHVTDTTPPAWTTTLPPASEVFECTPGDNMTTLTAVDACTDSNVTAVEEKIPGGCDHNYTLIRTWTTMDSCGNQQSYVQNVTVHDSIPPYGGPNNLTCFDVTSYTDKIVINNISVPNNFFAAGDACSSVQIILTACYSDRDADLPGDTPCTYNNATDTLILSGLIPTSDDLGRMYTIEAIIRDQCGHDTATTHQVFLPRDANSSLLRNLTDFDSSSCAPSEGNCDGSCPCQTVDHYCVQDAGYGASLAFVTKTLGADSTTFTYSLSGFTDRVVINLDLSELEVISASPDSVLFGWVAGSYLSGLSWTGAFSSGQLFSFTVAGTYATGSLGNVLTQVGGGAFTSGGTDHRPLVSCSVPAAVSGPVSSPSFVSSTPSISGKVAITGTRYGTAGVLSYPLAGVAVGVTNATSGLYVRVTLTDATGSYSFHDLGSLSSYSVILVEDGLLRIQARSSSQFLRASVNDVYGQGRYGPAQAAAATVNFGLLIDTDAEPIYNRPLANAGDGFEGAAKPQSYWAFIISEAAAGRYHEYSSSQLADFASIASALTPLSGPATPSSAGLAGSLSAAGLNAASGRGFFDPYGAVQKWYLTFADYVNANGGSAQDLSDAANFASFINNAADLDR